MLNRDFYAIIAVIDEICEEVPMNIEAIAISQNDARKLLGAANSDAALLYIYLNCGNPIQKAGQDLNMNESRISCAGAVLRQLGLWNEEKTDKNTKTLKIFIFIKK